MSGWNIGIFRDGHGNDQEKEAHQVIFLDLETVVLEWHSALTFLCCAIPGKYIYLSEVKLLQLFLESSATVHKRPKRELFVGANQERQYVVTFQ